MSDAIESPAADDVAPEIDRSTLEAQLELLTEENRRLRAELQTAKRSKYRRTAIGLIGVGILGLGAAYLFPSVRVVLLALGATGVFAGVLTYYITPERFVSATVAAGIYDVVARIGDALVTELGLADSRWYIPIESSTTDAGVRLFLPQRADGEIPPDEELQQLFVVSENERSFGVSMPPTGGAVFEEFEQATTGSLSDDPVALTEDLVDALVGQFELIERADIDPDLDNDHILVGISGSTLRSPDTFDHPVGSFLGVGLAIGLDRRVAVTVQPADGSARFEYLVDCSWGPPASQ